MDSREKAGPSERPNMQSANVLKRLYKQGIWRANVYWARGEGIGQPHVWMCHPGNAPPKNVFVCCHGNCWCVGGSWCNCEFASDEKGGEWGDGEKAGTAETFVSTGNKTSCAHTAAGQTLMNSFTHSFAYTLSHKTPACFLFVSPNQHSSFFLYLPSHLCSAIYFCLYSVSSSIITGTIGDSNHCTLEIDPEWKNYCFIFLTYCI